MTKPTDLRTLPNGQVLSDYRIGGVLGQGGFGITYLATDMNLEIKVAIKEYYPREFAVRDGTLTILAAGNDEDRETFKWGLTRFLEEARILARFEHPNIIAVRRFLEANGTAYLVMDYCDGEALDEIIKRDGPLSKERLDRILFPLLDGLEQIHSTNYLHRDIKPANLFIRADGSPVLLDFGAARQETGNHSRSVTSLATAGYAAVEQYSTRGKQGPWTDIYGLGATLYRAVTGEKPQESTDRMLEDTLVPAADKARGRYPENLLAAIDAAMAVRPEQRPQSVGQWRQMIGEPVPPSYSAIAYPLFPVATHKFIALSLCTLGIYQLYWCYQNWKRLKSTSSENLSPVWRAAFAPLWGFSLFARIRAVAVVHGVPVDWNSGALATCYLVLSLLHRLPDPWWLITFGALVPMIPVQLAAQRANEQHAGSITEPRNDRYSTANVATMVIGGLFVILAVIGSFMGD